MTPDLGCHIAMGWDRLLRELVLAENYRIIYLGFFGPALTRHPILEDLLPSLLYIKLVSILDDSLVAALNQRNLELPREYRPTLKGRIDFLRDRGLLKDAERLHGLRERRNQLAHEHESAVDWEAMKRALEWIEGELQHLGLVGPRPDYKPFYERSKVQAGDTPDVAFMRTYRVGLKLDGVVVSEFKWVERTYRDVQT